MKKLGFLLLFVVSFFIFGCGGGNGGLKAPPLPSDNEKKVLTKKDTNKTINAINKVSFSEDSDQYNPNFKLISKNQNINNALNKSLKVIKNYKTYDITDELCDRGTATVTEEGNSVSMIFNGCQSGGIIYYKGIIKITVDDINSYNPEIKKIELKDIYIDAYTEELRAYNATFEAINNGYKYNINGWIKTECLGKFVKVETKTPVILTYTNSINSEINSATGKILISGKSNHILIEYLDDSVKITDPTGESKIYTFAEYEALLNKDCYLDFYEKIYRR